MSIPPLVCSTPPPLEQCEDDKEPEDFDLHYHLSQEDNEENEYDYGNFTTCNTHFKSSENVNIKHLDLPGDSSTDVRCENILDNVIDEKDRQYTDTKVLSEEDKNVEDLDLKVDDQLLHKNSNNSQYVPEEVPNDLRDIIEDLQSDIPFTSKDIKQNYFITSSSNKIVKTIVLDSMEKPEVCQEIDKKVIDDTNIHQTKQFNEEITENIVDKVESDNLSKYLLTKNVIVGDAESISASVQIDNDFEDFDDFQYMTSDKKDDKVMNSETETPWGNSTSDDTGFGEFAANFEEDESKLSNPTPFVTEFSNTSMSSNRQFEKINSIDNNDDDDFGDFDKFKASTLTSEISSNEILPYFTTDSHVPVLSLQSSYSELQVIESVNKVLQSVFQEEISEPTCDFESSLDTCLGETWILLKETDVRQPYMVSWNNSLAQKTLLKALCIDSRNILFGPKWSSSMPKYAANLSVAPLQPQKHMSQANSSQSDTLHSEKAVNKNTWSDPFTSDGQEFTYAEALLLDLEHLMATLDQMANNHSTLKISELLSHACSAETNNTEVETGPTDLDVFEAAMTVKDNKIYSNILNIQPIRQINLPDTHIFTPTDSETPRSKTIHYNNANSPTILLPQPVPTTIKDQSEDSTPPIATNKLENDNNEYWDFQDFKRASDIIESVGKEQEIKNKDSHIVKHSSPNPNITYETQVLQPIKIETIMPTLNWPNPGQVKETFDDFADFVSNAATVNETQEPIAQPDPGASSTEQSVPTCNIEFSSKNQFDDEFDTFQSAVPQASEINSTMLQNMPIKRPDIDLVFSVFDKSKHEHISFANAKQAENFIQSVDLTPHVNELNFRSQTLSTSSSPATNPVLQPTLATSVAIKQNPQNAGQILQPLSLESYSKINWPNPGIDLQDLSRFNPVETLQSFKSDINSQSKNSSPIHNHKTIATNQTTDDDIWGEFVSSKPKPQSLPKKQATFPDDDEWTEFVSSPSVNPQNGLNTISFNVHTNSNTQKSNSNKYPSKNNEVIDIPTLNYITPKTSTQKSFNDRHFQNL